MLKDGDRGGDLTEIHAKTEAEAARIAKIGVGIVFKLGGGGLSKYILVLLIKMYACICHLKK